MQEMKNLNNSLGNSMSDHAINKLNKLEKHA